MSKTKANNDYINAQRLEGRSFCYLNELPHPSCANLSVKRGPALSADHVRVVFQTLDDNERELLEAQIN